jgi:glycosyltransferase involved in cell wall biosynthesis
MFDRVLTDHSDREGQVILEFGNMSTHSLVGYFDLEARFGVPTGQLTETIVATRLPASREALHNEETALLVTYGEVNGLANELARLIRDREKRHRLVSAIAAPNNSHKSRSEIAKAKRRCRAEVLRASTAGAVAQ